MIFYRWFWIRWLFKYGKFLWVPLEKRWLKEYGKEESRFPVVFIVGAPRSGSTIMYQVMTRYLDVSYIDNFVNLARECTITGFTLSRKLFGQPHHSLESRYGDTSHQGLHAPNEGLFWYRWLPIDKHHVSSSDLDERQTDEMRSTFRTVLNKFSRPFVVKNLTFSMRLGLIHDMFPDAKLIHVTRNPVFMAQSILLARKKLGIPEGEIWSTKPGNEDELVQADENEMVVRQIYEIEKEIHRRKALFLPGRYLNIRYEDFLKNPWETNNVIATYIKCEVRKRTVEDELAGIRNGNVKRIADRDFSQLGQLVNKFDWDNFTD